MKVFSVSLTAGVQVSVRGGNFLMLIDTSAPIDVTLMRGGAEIEKAESVEAGFKAHARFADLREDGGRYFDEARLLSATTQTVKVGVSDGAGGYDRALGEVTAEEKLTQTAAAPVGIDALVDNGVCFTGFVTSPATASAYGHLQFWNPAASGKRAYLERITLSQGTSGTVIVDSVTAALANLSNTGGVNQKLGGAAGSIELRYEANAAQLVAQPYIWANKCQQLEPVVLDIHKPIIVLPGYGVTITAEAVNNNVYGVFQWREYAI